MQNSYSVLFHTFWVMSIQFSSVAQSCPVELGRNESGWEMRNESAPKNWCFWTVVLEKALESPLDSKEIQPVHPKGNQSWIFFGSWNSNTLATWCKELIHLKIPWCWERLKAGDRGWDGWMASPTQWTRVWVSSKSWWWTGRPGMLQSMGSQRVRHNWVNELNTVRKTSWSWSLPCPDWKSLPKALHRDKSTDIQRTSSLYLSTLAGRTLRWSPKSPTSCVIALN